MGVVVTFFKDRASHDWITPSSSLPPSLHPLFLFLFFLNHPLRGSSAFILPHSVSLSRSSCTTSFSSLSIHAPGSSWPSTCPFSRSKLGRVPQVSLFLSLVQHPFIFSWLRLVLLHTCHFTPLQNLSLSLASPASQPPLVPHLIRSSSVILISWPAFLISSLLNPPLYSCMRVWDREAERERERERVRNHR